MGNQVSTLFNDMHEPISPLAREHRRPSISWEETVPVAPFSPTSLVERTTKSVSYRARDGQLYVTREEAHQANEVYYISHPEAKSQHSGMHRANTDATMKSVKTVYNGPMCEEAIDDGDDLDHPLVSEKTKAV